MNEDNQCINDDNGHNSEANSDIVNVYAESYEFVESEAFDPVVKQRKSAGKRKVGRPARGSGSAVCQISMTVEEKEFFREMSGKMGMSMSSFARIAMNEYLRLRRISRGSFR